MFEDIKQILSENYGIKDIDLNTDFKKDLGLNSFDLMNLVCLVEERYSIELDEEKYRKMTTIGQMCDYLKTLIEE
jgi:acyl carrier protein